MNEDEHCRLWEINRLYYLTYSWVTELYDTYRFGEEAFEDEHEAGWVDADAVWGSGREVLRKLTDADWTNCVRITIALYSDHILWST